MKEHAHARLGINPTQSSETYSESKCGFWSLPVKSDVSISMTDPEYSFVGDWGASVAGLVVVLTRRIFAPSPPPPPPLEPS
jgi:hypothetical protein